MLPTTIQWIFLTHFKISLDFTVTFTASNAFIIIQSPQLSCEENLRTRKMTQFRCIVFISKRLYIRPPLHTIYGPKPTESNKSEKEFVLVVPPWNLISFSEWAPHATIEFIDSLAQAVLTPECVCVCVCSCNLISHATTVTFFFTVITIFANYECRIISF